MTETSKRPAPFPNGSTWVRADFHMHTIADKEFAFEGESNQFVGQYVDRMKEAGIRVGVITNHNKFDEPEFKALRKAAKKKSILLLPGVELSVKDGSNGIHTLIVFHPSWVKNIEGFNHIQSFLNSAFAGQSSFENENGRSNHDLDETVRQLNQFGRDYFIIFAHVEENNGLWGGLSGGRLGELKEPVKSRCLGFQKVRTRDDRDKVQQQLAGWYPAEVEGCDCKSVEQIGQGQLETHVKIGSFTFEAVKYALTDYGHRVKTQAHQTAHSHISSVSFEGGCFDGKRVQLSPEMNALIGIRGSGKSSLLEAIRYALEIELGAKASDKKYKEALIPHTLSSGGRIVVEAIDRHGKTYEVRRILHQKPDVFVDDEQRVGIKLRETVVHQPIYFGQKDLSSSVEGFEDELVEKLVGDKLASCRASIATAIEKVTATVRKLKTLNEVQTKRDELQEKLKDAEYRLEIFKEHDVETKLKKQVCFEQDVQATKSVTTFLDQLCDELRSTISKYETDFATSKHESEENTEFFESFFELLEKARIAFTAIDTEAKNLKEHVAAIQDKANELVSVRDSLKEEFAETERTLVDELKSKGVTSIKPDAFLKINETIVETKSDLETIGKETQKRADLEEELTKEMTALNECWRSEFKVIEGELNKINACSDALTIEIEFKGERDAFFEKLRSTFSGNHVQKAAITKLVAKYQDGIAMFRDRDCLADAVGNSAAKIGECLEQNLTKLLTYQVPNRVTIKYHGKVLTQHSLGQRASALILFVLSQNDNDVVIIDQPEDDLDNQTIYEDVIKLIRELKSRTQFIFATHNANFPVLGDAEQIIACSLDDDDVELTIGSIDEPKIQEAVVNIMEGGAEAFKRRKKIYEIWRADSKQRDSQ